MALILLIIVVNLALGFAAAIALGYGPPGPAEMWLVLQGATAYRRAPAALPAALPSLAPPPDASPEQLTGMLDADDAEAELSPLAQAYDDDAADVARAAESGGARKLGSQREVRRNVDSQAQRGDDEKRRAGDTDRHPPPRGPRQCRCRNHRRIAWVCSKKTARPIWPNKPPRPTSCGRGSTSWAS